MTKAIIFAAVTLSMIIFAIVLLLKERKKEP